MNIFVFRVCFVLIAAAFSLVSCASQPDPFAAVPKLKLQDSFVVSPHVVGVHMLGNGFLLGGDLEGYLDASKPGPREYIISTRQRQVVADLN